MCEACMAVSSKAIALDRLNVSAKSYIYIYAVRSFLPTSPSAPWEAIATTSGTTALQQFSVIAARGVEPILWEAIATPSGTTA